MHVITYSIPRIQDEIMVWEELVFLLHFITVDVRILEEGKIAVFKVI